MYESVLGFFFSHPRLVTRCGRALIKAAAFLGLLGVVGYTVKQILLVAQGLSKTPPLASLADAYGTGITWFVPEGLVGVVVVLVLAVTGLSAIHWGTEIDRM